VLASLLGVRVMMLIGQTIPLPAPAELLTNLSQIEVSSDATRGDGFQLTFQLSKKQPVDYDLLLNGSLDPFKRVVLAVVLGVTPEVLIDGVITQHQLTPSNEPGQSTLTVTGRDISIMLDLEEHNTLFRNQTDSIIVTQLLMNYAQCGLVGPHRITPTFDVPIETQRIPRQAETDFAFINRMAMRNGFVFYVEPVTLGVTSAYWGPENRLSLPQPALTVGMGSLRNINSLSFTNDALAPVGATGSYVEPFSKTTIPIPALPALRIPPLALQPAQPRRTVLLRESANLDSAQAATSALAAATRAPEAVSGSGELDGVRYGAVLRARRLVGVRGAGFAYDGNYLVTRVSHALSRGSYTQRFTLTREGTGSLLPVVRP
jgi:hypothetical protein